MTESASGWRCWRRSTCRGPRRGRACWPSCTRFLTCLKRSLSCNFLPAVITTCFFGGARREIRGASGQRPGFITKGLGHCRTAGVPIQVQVEEVSGLLYALVLTFLHEDDFGPGNLKGTVDTLMELVAAFCLGEVEVGNVVAGGRGRSGQKWIRFKNRQTLPVRSAAHGGRVWVKKKVVTIGTDPPRLVARLNRGRSGSG